MSEDTVGIRRAARDAIQRMRTVWPAHRWTDEYRDELGRAMVAAAGEPGDVTEATERVIRSHDGRYPPPVGNIAQAVAKRGAARKEREKDRERTERQKRRRLEHVPNEPWHGWLAVAACAAHAIDREDPMRFSAGFGSTLAPFLEMVRELGYRNHHGCAGDPLHHPVRTAGAVEAAERIWRECGMPAAPSPMALVGGGA